MKTKHLILFILILSFCTNRSFSQVDMQDSLALIDLFQALNPEAQECLNWNDNSFTNPITEWEGVILQEDFLNAARMPTFVFGLELNDKCIKGHFPEVVNSLSGLTTFSCRDNEITSLPDFTLLNLSVIDCGNNRIRELSNLPPFLNRLSVDNNRLRDLDPITAEESVVVLDTLDCAHNELTFEDLVEAINSEIVLFIEDYTGQKGFGVHDYYLYPGMDISLDLYPEVVDNFFNNYRWEKDGELFFEESQRTVPFTGISLSDTGTYQLTVTHPDFEDLVLEGAIRIHLEDQDNMPFDTSTIIVKYPLEVTPVEVAEQQAVLEKEGWILLQECWCGGQSAPRLQLYQGDDKTLFELATTRSSRRVRVATDTTELNYFLINNPIIESTSEVDCGEPFVNPDKWEYNVKTALIDSGSDPNHTGLVNRYWRNPIPNTDENCLANDTIGWDFPNDSSLIVDRDGHGTHVMGSIAYRMPTDIQLEVMNLKVFEEGMGLLFDLVCAMNYAVDVNAQVTNISLGYYAEKPSGILYESLQRAKEAGMIVAVSAGNESSNLDILSPDIQRWPASFKVYNDSMIKPLDNLIVVGALNGSQDSLATFSNYGSMVDIAAPGTGIRSTLPGNDYGTLSGTSMATAFVSSVASIMRAYDPDASYLDIIDCIRESAASFVFDDRVAWEGKLDRNAALACFGVAPPAGSNIEGERPRTLSVFPNPFLDRVNVILADGDAVFEDVSFTVTSLGGSQIYSESCSASSLYWDGLDQNGREATRGLYFIWVQVGDTRPFVMKVFKL